LIIHPYKLKYSANVENVKVNYKIVGFNDSAMIIYRSAELLEYKGDFIGPSKTVK